MTINLNLKCVKTPFSMELIQALAGKLLRFYQHQCL